MTRRDSNDRRIRAAEEAADWALRLEAGHISSAEKGEFVDWLRESPIHVAEILRFAQIQNALTEFTGWNELKSEERLKSTVVPLSAYADIPPARVQISSHVKVLRRLALIAASIATIAVSTLLVSGHFERSVVRTQPLERREITLADGSMLSIAPDSVLHIHLTKKERSVSLDRGEALFHVAKDHERPFVVTADQTRVRAVGTAFSVERRVSGVVVTVAEGRVAVTPKTTSTVLSEHANGATVSLGANEQLTVSSAGDVSQTRSIDSRAELAWAESELIFENSSVAEVVRRFNLRNRVQIRILDPSLASRSVSGVFNGSDPQSFVSFLEAVAGVKAVHSDTQEILVGTSPAASSATSAH